MHSAIPHTEASSMGLFTTNFAKLNTAILQKKTINMTCMMNFKQVENRQLHYFKIGCLNHTMSVVFITYTSNHYDINTNLNTVPMFVHHNLWLNHHKLSRVALNQNTVTFYT